MMRSELVLRLSRLLVVVCLILLSSALVAGQGKPKKPTKPPNPGNTDRTRFEVSLLDPGDHTSWNPTGAPVLVGELGTANMPNDCVTSFRVAFNVRAPLAWIDPVVLPGVDGDIGTTDDNVTIDVDGGSGFSITLGKSEPSWIDSVGMFISSYPDQEGYQTENLENLDIYHPCPIGPGQSFTIGIQQVLDVLSKKGKKPVGRIAIGDLLFEYDCDQDQATANPSGC
jgi:hypothetical protein